MEFLILGVGLALAVVFWLALNRQAHQFRTELQGLRQENQSALTQQLGQIGQSFQQQLTDVREALQRGLTDAGQISSKTQETVGQRLAEAAKLISNVSQQLGGLQEAGRQLRDTAGTLESILSGARTRGSLGEIALDRLLADALPKKAYELQYRFSSGGVVDAAVFLREKVLPIDSKFPLDAYRRLAEADDEKEKELARKEFARVVRKHAADIAGKYILPAEGTLDVAFMFLASEGIYYEILLTEDGKGPLGAGLRELRVFPVSPNTLYAYLAVILMGLRGIQVEENARLILASLSGLQTDLETFRDVYGKLGIHLKNASQSYQDATARLEKVERGLTTLQEGRSPVPLEAESALRQDS